MKRPTLRRRLYSLLTRWFLLFLAASGVVSWYSFVRFRNNVLEDRLLLARTVAHYLDATISGTFHSLDRLTSELPSLDTEVAGRLRSFRFQGLFRDEIYLLDAQGRQLVADPGFAEPLPARWLNGRELVTPLFYKPGEGTRPALAIVQPFQRATKSYFLVSEMNPLGSAVSTFLQNLAAEPDLHLVVVDVSGTVIAAPDQGKLFRSLGADGGEAARVSERIASHRPLVWQSDRSSICDDGGGTFLTVMVPLRYAPWGVVVQQHRRRAFAALYSSQYGYFAAAGLLVLMGVFLTRALSRSVVAPIHALSEQAELLRRGDLSRPFRVGGDHEIHVLATTLDEARGRLASTLDELQQLNESLEVEVASRTRVLRAQYDDLRLLHDISQVTTRERRPERFVPQILELIGRHYRFEEAALVTTPRTGSPGLYTWPEGSPFPWLAPGAPAPPGWNRRDLDYQGRSKAQLYFRRAAGSGEPVLEALEDQLAVTLHGAYLLERTLSQDAQRKVLVKRLLAAGEDERRRIARELHDEISQLLAVIQMTLEEGPADDAGLRKAKELLVETQEEIHRIIYDLRPSLLDDLGLAAAVKWYADNYLGKQGIQVSLEVEETLELPPELDIAVFRIYQEIVTNILRHARADTVSVELYVDGGDLILAVEDDGVGFHPEEKFEGVGIVGMRERADLVGGALSFDSEPGLGTHVRLRIPLPS